MRRIEAHRHFHFFSCHRSGWIRSGWIPIHKIYSYRAVMIADFEWASKTWVYTKRLMPRDRVQHTLTWPSASDRKNLEFESRGTSKCQTMLHEVQIRACGRRILHILLSFSYSTNFSLQLLPPFVSLCSPLVSFHFFSSFLLHVPNSLRE